MTDPWMPMDELRKRTTEKWRAHPADVLPLFVAEMDTGLAEPVVRAVTEAMALGDSGYPTGSRYAEAFTAFAGKRWGWEPAVEHTLLVPDVMAGLAEVLRGATDPGDPIIVNDPVYPPFYEMIRHLGRRIVEVPLTAEHRLDLDALAAAFAEFGGRGRVAHLLCNPQNPTGTVHTREELTALAELAAEHGVRVVADEIHAPLVDGNGGWEADGGGRGGHGNGGWEADGGGRGGHGNGGWKADGGGRGGHGNGGWKADGGGRGGHGAYYTPYLTVPGTATATVLHSASKGWNLAGLKAALAVAGADVAGELAALPSTVRDGASHIAVLAHVAALSEGGRWLDDLLAALARNRALLADLVAEHLPGVTYRPAPSTYLAWLDCRGAGLDGDPADVFLERARVALVSGPSFGTSGAGHVRLNLATSPEIITEAVRRMATALPG